MTAAPRAAAARTCLEHARDHVGAQGAVGSSRMRTRGSQRQRLGELEQLALGDAELLDARR